MSGDLREEVAVAFTGSQAGCAKPLQYDALRVVLGRVRIAGIEWMRNGDCIGADDQAGLLWQWHDGKLHLFPANIKSKRAHLVGDRSEAPAAPLTRNRLMVDRAVAVVATPSGATEELRSGTWATIRYARKLSRPLCIIWPDGTHIRENWPTEGLRALSTPARLDAVKGDQHG